MKFEKIHDISPLLGVTSEQRKNGISANYAVLNALSKTIQGSDGQIAITVPAQGCPDAVIEGKKLASAVKSGATISGNKKTRKVKLSNRDLPQPDVKTVPDILGLIPPSVPDAVVSLPVPALLKLAQYLQENDIQTVSLAFEVPDGQRPEDLEVSEAVRFFAASTVGQINGVMAPDKAENFSHVIAEFEESLDAMPPTDAEPCKNKKKKKSTASENGKDGNGKVKNSTPPSKSGRQRPSKSKGKSVTRKITKPTGDDIDSLMESAEGSIQRGKLAAAKRAINKIRAEVFALRGQKKKQYMSKLAELEKGIQKKPVKKSPKKKGK